MPAIKYLPVSWDTYHALAQSLAQKILLKHQKFDQVVAISRGGLTLGHLLTDFLRIPIATITIQSYTDIQTQGELKITQKLQVPIRGEHILLVDDVADTGKTLKRALTYLKRFRPQTITTGTLFYKPHSVFTPDFYVETTSKWILFPYEPTEMIRLIKGSRTFLKSLQFTDSQIDFVKKFYP